MDVRTRTYTCVDVRTRACVHTRAGARAYCSVYIVIADVFPLDIWLHLMEGKSGFRIRKLTRGF